MATSSHSTDGDGPSEFMFTFNKTNFSEIESSVSSPPYIIQNILWRIVIKKIENKEVTGLGKYLGFYLSCKANNPWICPVRATLTLVSQKKGIPNFFRIIEDISSSEKNEFGFSDFAEWLDVIDPQCGFIVDDTVKFQAHILADIPNTDCLNLLENVNVTEDPQKLEDGLSLLATEWDEDMVRRISQEVKDARNSLRKEQQAFMEEAIKRLKGDLKISIESAVRQLREEINSVKNDLKVLLNSCDRFRKEDLEEPDFQSELRKVIDKRISEKLLADGFKSSQSLISESRSCADLHTSLNPAPPRSYCGYNSRSDDYCTSRLPSQLESCCSLNSYRNERGSDCSACNHCPMKQNEEHLKECRMNFDDYSCDEKNELEDINISYEHEPLEKEVLLISPDENGRLITFRPTSSEELSALKKKYPRFQIL